jgi:DNA polymerase-3 subunit gamma/tau
VIALSPNWENMIKTRKAIVEQAVKEVFGNDMKTTFITKEK